MRRPPNLTTRPGRGSILPLLLLPLLLFSGCALTETAFLPDIHGIPYTSPHSAAERIRACRDLNNYIPDTSAQGRILIPRQLRVNFHFLNSTDSLHNLSPADGETFARYLPWEGNKRLQNNAVMIHPEARHLPNWPTRFSLRLTPMPNAPYDNGIYFHYDDELFFYIHKGPGRNLADRRVIDTYAIQPDSVLNVFLMPNQRHDEVDPGAYTGGLGIALGKAIKIPGVHRYHDRPWEHLGTFLHEIGHVLGLSHTWAFNDGCDDTPHHPNCFGYGDPPCDSLVSNNVMDYNQWRTAWTPCQLGKVHSNFSRRQGWTRPLLRRNWCVRNPGFDLRIADAQEWWGERDLLGHIDLLPGSRLTLHCRVSIPAGARITVHPGATLILDGAELHNDCGLPWEGVFIQRKGRRKGRVLLGPDWSIDRPSVQP
jgi:hypothetical protein